MLRYLISRLLLLVPTLFLILLLTFVLASMGPIDPVVVVRQQLASQGIMLTPESAHMLRQELGLDKPVWVRFGRYVGNILRGDFGESFYSRTNVGSAIVRSFVISGPLGLAAMFILIIVGVPLGVLAALRQNTGVDYLVVGSSVVFHSIPAFVLAPMVLLIVVLGVGMKFSLGWHGLFTPIGILVSILLAVGPMAVVVRQTRAGILEVFANDYVRTARAKGLPEKAVIFRHILRNALIPVVTSLGLMMSGLITGSVFLDSIFGLAGFGGLFYQSIATRDYAILMSCVLVSAFLVIGSNLLVDMIYPFLDPRVKFN